MRKPLHNHADLHEVPPSVPALSVQNATVSYGEETILHDISFEVRQGEIAAIIGPNGSGKSTLLRTILGLHKGVTGEIRLFGKHMHAVRSLIGYVPQRFDFDRDFPLSVGEFMELARHKHCPRSRIPEKLREVGMGKESLDLRMGMLSGGQLQRVLIAQAILNNPAILFLDEPNSGIDVAGEATFYELIEHLNREHDTTVILVSHDLSHVSALVDNVVCVNKRLLCYGPPNDALTARSIGELFGSDKAYEHKHVGSHGHGKRETQKRDFGH